jgi:predicted peptidase
MRLLAAILLSISLAPGASADVDSELRRMLARFPEADTNGDGVLSEQEAMDYTARTFRKGLVNRGSALRDKALTDPYESRQHQNMPFRLLRPLKVEAGRRYPLIVSLHGSGGVGDDNVSNLRQWNGVMAASEWRKRYPCFVLVPQALPGGMWGPKPSRPELADVYVKNMLPLVFEVVKQLQEEFPIDSGRIYALGSSGGGTGTWNILATRPEMFAAAIPVCGGRFPERLAERLVDIPIWCFHGDADERVPVGRSRDAFDRLKELGGNMKYTELRDVGHAAWVPAFVYEGDNEAKGYRTRCSGERCDRTANVWDWLFRQTK